MFACRPAIIYPKQMKESERLLQECQAGSCGRVDVSLKDALTAKAKAIVYAFSPTDVNLSSCITP